MTAIPKLSAASRTAVFAGGAVTTITEAGYLAVGRTGALVAVGGWATIIIIQFGGDAPRPRERQWVSFGLLLGLGCFGGAVTLAIANGHADARLAWPLLLIVFASAAFIAEATIRIVRLEWARSRTGRLRFGMCWTGIVPGASWRAHGGGLPTGPPLVSSSPLCCWRS